ncbi:MAG: N-acetylmuramoyl-L-alanine amidase [Pseudomonadota bacterium]|nr:N-acetylmuramoyl-L-alanine amidase [Pseudomonadota bacterium]
MLLLVSLAFAHPSVETPVDLRAPAIRRNLLTAAFDAAADEYGVPKPLLMAIAWEASHFDPDVQSAWGGYGMFDLREGSQDPSLEHAAALLEVDPNVMVADWELQVRGAAAILADQGRLSNAGVLPPRADLLAWWDAVRAFSGREEPLLQEQYASYVYETAAQGVVKDTRWGAVLLEPQDLDLAGRRFVPPPTATDSSLAYQFYAASSSNYTNDSRGSGDIDMVVIHTVQGSYSGCYSWFANSSASASAQYVVRSSDGQITQMVSEADVAWHAGHWDTNARSIGIEHEGYVSDPGTWYTDAMYEHSAALTVDIASRQGVSLDRTHIIGHVEVPGCDGGSGGGASCHTDPGTGWDWDHYMDLVNGETGTSGGEIIGVVADSDIYNGARLAGANVWIAETGGSTTVEADGYYRFDDIPFGTYTMHATYPGYAEGTCTKTTSSSQDWCSIVLFPDDGGGDDTDEPVEDTDEPVDEDTDEPPVEDTGIVTPPGDTDRPGPPALPGQLTRMDQTGRRVCGTASAPTSLVWLALAPLLGLRRRSLAGVRR